MMQLPTRHRAMGSVRKGLVRRREDARGCRRACPRTLADARRI